MRSAASRIFPVSSPTYDYYGADRHGANLFSDCLLALDARTGKRLWHFQMVHHDLWDYDPTAAPQLITVRKDGKTHRRRGAGHQARFRVRVRSRDGQAGVADRGAKGAAERCARRSGVAHAAVLDVAAERAPGRHARRPHAVPDHATPSAPPGASASARRAPDCSIHRRLSKAPSCPAPSAAPTGATRPRIPRPACSIY